MRSLVNEGKCAWIKIPWENQQKQETGFEKVEQTGGARN